MVRWILTLLVCLPLSVPAYSTANLTGLRIQAKAAASRLTFILNQKAKGKVHYLPNQNKLLIEFENVRKDFGMSEVRLKNANINSVRLIKINANKLRFLVKVTHKIHWQIKYITQKPQLYYLQLTIKTLPKPPQRKSSKPQKLNQQEIQKMLVADISHALKTLKTKKTITKKVTFFAYQKEDLVPNRARKRRPFIIIIDPGHGGKDVGAIGKNGTFEKNIVLFIARKLAREINLQPHFRAILTRQGDYYIPLRERLRLARSGRADLFIAIHADAYFNNRALGASVYALSQRGATTEAARWLAQQEKYPELDQVAFDQLKDHSHVLRSVLIDLAQTATIRDSLRLGNALLDQLDQVGSLHYSHVEQAPFVVLKSPDIPSVLIETGFITNPYEEKRLRTLVYQQQLALAIWRGIYSYVSKYESQFLQA